MAEKSKKDKNNEEDETIQYDENDYFMYYGYGPEKEEENEAK